MKLKLVKYECDEFDQVMELEQLLFSQWSIFSQMSEKQRAIVMDPETIPEFCEKMSESLGRFYKRNCGEK